MVVVKNEDEKSGLPAGNGVVGGGERRGGPRGRGRGRGAREGRCMQATTTVEEIFVVQTHCLPLC